MKNLSLTFCLVIAALFGSVGGGLAGSDLPPCPSSGFCHNCFGIHVNSNGGDYVRVFKDNKYNGSGTYNCADAIIAVKYVG